MHKLDVVLQNLVLARGKKIAHNFLILKVDRLFLAETGCSTW